MEIGKGYEEVFMVKIFFKDIFKFYIFVFRCLKIGINVLFYFIFKKGFFMLLEVIWLFLVKLNCSFVDIVESKGECVG